MRHRKYLIAGNWKMNISSNDVKDLVDDIIDGSRNITNVGIVLCPPFTTIPRAQQLISRAGNILLGAQNLYPEKHGAYTGEISAIMLRELGVSHVIVGHSERRTIFGESDQFINRKVKYALGNNLTPIVCVGETIDERKAGKQFSVVEKQMTACLDDIRLEMSDRVVIAYEPVWAIGTGETATPDTAQEMHAFIRRTLSDLFSSRIADVVKILYGGSMTSSNAGALLRMPDIDGGLIGGASLKAGDFCKIIHLAHEASK